MSTVNRHHWTLYVRGIYGRNRTEKRTHVRLFAQDAADASPTPEVLDAAIGNALRDLRVKQVRWYVNRENVERETYSDGVVIEKYLLHSGVTVASGQVV